MDLKIIEESDVKKLLDWNDCFEAVKQALLAVLNIEGGATTSQTIRTGTVVPEKSGILLTMPGYVGNYPLNMLSTDKKYSTLACKMISVFRKNPPPIPTVTATLFLFETEFGKLKALIEATEITAWRTAAVSLVATQYLFFNRSTSNSGLTLTILGCGEQGRAHAFGFLNYFKNKFAHVRLWNRTKSKAEKLQRDLMESFSGLQISVVDKSSDCVKIADVIVTATNTDNPLFSLKDMKPRAHINGNLLKLIG